MNSFTVTEVNKAFENEYFDTLLEAKNFFFSKIEEYKKFPSEYKELCIYNNPSLDKDVCMYRLPEMIAIIENGVLEG
jgi:hypothetical protein